MPAHEGHDVAGLELGQVVGELADPQLRAREILQDGHLALRPPGRLAHAARGLGVVLPGAVREVQPRDVHARLDHPHKHLRVARGRADGGDDLVRRIAPAT